VPVEQVDDLGEVAQGTAEPVHLVDHDHIDLVRLHVIQQSLQARTVHRLPPVRVQGYFNTWPAILRQPWKTFSGDDACYHFPPDPAAIDRMEVTMRCVLWLGEEERHLVWRRVEGWRWRDICRRIGCDRTAAWRR